MTDEQYFLSFDALHESTFQEKVVDGPPIAWNFSTYTQNWLWEEDDVEVPGDEGDLWLV